MLIEEIDVTVGTGAVNESRSFIDDQPEAALIREGVTGMLTFLIHAS